MFNSLPVDRVIRVLAPFGPKAAHGALDQWRAEHLLPLPPGAGDVSSGLLRGNRTVLAIVFAVLREHLIDLGQTVGTDRDAICEAWLRSLQRPPLVVSRLIEEELRNALEEQAPIGPLAASTVRIPLLDPLVQHLEFQWLIDLDTGNPSLKAQVLEDICCDEPLEQIAEAWGNHPDDRMRYLGDQLVRKWALNNPGQVSQSAFVNPRLAELKGRHR